MASFSTVVIFFIILYLLDNYLNYVRCLYLNYIFYLILLLKYKLFQIK